jgi:NAD-dependent deacetylase
MLDDLAQAIRDASHCAVLTGAGVSTLSGLADFRSPGQEIWDRFDQTTVFDIGEFHRNPDTFHLFAQECLVPMLSVEPSEVHTLLARMENAGMLQHLATQNIDGLHQRAGSTNVAELHGGVTSGRCQQCGEPLNLEKMLAFFKAPPTPPCASCGGRIKADVVFYGEALPEAELGESMRQARSSEVYLVFGSSLQVTPAAHLPVLAAQSGARVAIINRDPTAMDGLAEWAIRDDLRDVAAELTRLLALDS